MARLFVVAGVTQAGQYALHKKHTSLQQCLSVQDVLSVVGIPDAHIVALHADYGLMHGYATDPHGIWSSLSATVDPGTPVDALAQYLPHDVMLHPDDASLPATRLKAGGFVLIIDIELQTHTHTHQSVFDALRDMGFAEDAIQSRYMQLSDEQCQLERRAILTLLLNLLT
jgi:hypothetical protein